MLRRITALVVLIYLVLPALSNAQSTSGMDLELKSSIAIPDKEPSGTSDESTTLSILKFTSGVAFSYLIHEGSHLIVAKMTNTNMDVRTGTFNQITAFEEHSNTRSKGLAINSAGLISHLVSSEIILDVNKIDKNDSFVRGMMLWNVLNPLIYTLDYWVIRSTNKIENNRYQGDIAGIEYYSSKDVANGYALGITALAAFQGYRFLKTQSWAPDWLKNDYKVNLVPLHSGGFMVGYKIEF